MRFPCLCGNEHLRQQSRLPSIHLAVTPLLPQDSLAALTRLKAENRLVCVTAVRSSPPPPPGAFSSHISSQAQCMRADGP